MKSVGLSWKAHSLGTLVVFATLSVLSAQSVRAQTDDRVAKFRAGNLVDSAITETLVPPAANAVLTFRDGMTPPEQLEGKPIVYSQAAIEAGVQGTIEAKCVINVRGALENCRILKSLPYMDKAVLQALATRKYTPVLLEGKPVPVEYVFAIKLVLKEKERKCVGSRCESD